MDIQLRLHVAELERQLTEQHNQYLETLNGYAAILQQFEDRLGQAERDTRYLQARVRNLEASRSRVDWESLAS